MTCVMFKVSVIIDWSPDLLLLIVSEASRRCFIVLLIRSVDWLFVRPRLLRLLSLRVSESVAAACFFFLLTFSKKLLQLNYYLYIRYKQLYFYTYKYLNSEKEKKIQYKLYIYNNVFKLNNLKHLYNKTSFFNK